MPNKIDIGGAMFGKPHFTANDSQAGGNPPDPAVPTRIRVTLDNLEPYAGNPRTKPNPNYNEIKESIRHRGLDHAPNVTRPTPDQPYMINDGGNTRLQILNELWQETGDRKFFEIDCMFRPWKSERDVLVAHIIENEMRGRMSFIDRARAAMRLKPDLEVELGKELSMRELASAITNLGWSLKAPNLSAMIYAYETLLQVIPETLDTGMGRPSILAIKRMLEECRTYWESVAQEHEGDFDSIWHPVFQEMDSYGAFDIDIARDKIEEGIAARLNCPVSAIRAEIQGVAAGYVEPGHRPEDLFKPGQAPDLPQGEAQPVISSQPDQPRQQSPEARDRASSEAAANSSIEHSPAPSTAHAPEQHWDHEPEVLEAARGTAFDGGHRFADPDSTGEIGDSHDTRPSAAPASGERVQRTPKEFSVEEAKDAVFKAAKHLADLCGFGRGVLSAREAGIATPEPYMLHVGSMHDVPEKFRDAALDIFGLMLETTLTVSFHIGCTSASANDMSTLLYQNYLAHDHLDMHLIRLTVSIHKTHPHSLPGMDLRGGSTEHWAEILEAFDKFYYAQGLFLHTYCEQNPHIQHSNRALPGASQ